MIKSTAKVKMLGMSHKTSCSSHLVTIILGQTFMLKFKAEPQPARQETLCTAFSLSLWGWAQKAWVAYSAAAFSNQSVPAWSQSAHTSLNILRSEEHGTEYPRGKLKMFLWQPSVQACTQACTSIYAHTVIGSYSTSEH